MRLSIDVTLAFALNGYADVLLLIEAAAMADQRLEQQDLLLYCDGSIGAQPGLDGIGQRSWVQGSDHLRAEYRAIVAIDRPLVDLAILPATAPHKVAADAVPYLLPSRYSEYDRFGGFL